MEKVGFPHSFPNWKSGFWHSIALFQVGRWKSVERSMSAPDLKSFYSEVLKTEALLRHLTELIKFHLCLRTRLVRNLHLYEAMII